MLLTSKQQSIMKHIIAGNPNNTAVDIDQLLERLDYKTTKESLQFSLRALIGHGLIRKADRELRRDRVRQTLVPTGFGKQVYAETVPSFVTDITSDTDLSELL